MHGMAIVDSPRPLNGRDKGTLIICNHFITTGATGDSAYNYIKDLASLVNKGSDEITRSCVHWYQYTFEPSTSLGRHSEYLHQDRPCEPRAPCAVSP